MSESLNTCDMNQSDILNFSEQDDLGLTKININDIPKDILFPEEYTQYLKGQIQFLVQSNARLEQALTRKEDELHEFKSKTVELNSKLSEYEIITKELSGQSVSVNSSRFMSTKIVELSKKLREKNSELESLKTKFSKLQQKILFIENSKTSTIEVSNDGPSEAVNADQVSEQLKSIQEKLTTTTNKLFETKNQNLQLKNDIKLANKILQQELGENFTSIQAYINSNTNWRGRAQQILALQQKNAELVDKLSTITEKDSSSLVSTPKTDNRKLIIEQLNRELAAVKSELEDSRKRLNAARARIKVLETECFTAKSKLTSHTEKLHSDEQLIKLLKQQVTCLEDSQTSILKDNQATWENQTKNYNLELSKERCKLENMKKTLAEKESKITEMKNELEKLGKSGTSEDAVNPNQTKDQVVRLNVLEVEVQRLMELVAVLNTRLDAERALHSETQLTYRKERQKAAKLETKLLRAEMENNMYKSQMYSKSGSKNSNCLTASTSCDDSSPMTLEGLKNSLELSEENIKALQTRLVILQREKDMDFQRFSGILNDTQNIIKKHEVP